MPIQDLLARLRDVRQLAPGKWESYCPIHESAGDHEPSLKIDLSASGEPLLHCFVCPEAKLVHFCHAVGLAQHEVFSRPLSGGGAAGKKRRRPTSAKKVAEYLYRDSQGAILYKACRYEWEENGQQRKDFDQFRPNGEGGWINNLKGVPRVLYRLPELLAADKALVVYLVEGEKKVDRLREWGLTATCNVGGSSGKWLQAYCDALAGRHLVILPDNDPVNRQTGERAGNAWAVRILKAMTGTAASVRIVELPGLENDGSDVMDWIAAGGTLPQLLEIVAAATDDEAKRIAADAEKQKAEAEAVRRDQITNWEDEIDGEGLPVPMDDILRRINATTNGWPRKAAGVLFVHDQTDTNGHQVHWMDRAPALFGYLGSVSKCCPSFTRKKNAHSKEEVYCEIHRRAVSYDGVETLPHEPLLPRHYYCCGPVESGDGRALADLLDRFNPETPTDRDLIAAMFATIFWGGQGGARPAFVITSDDGRGAGKTKMAGMVSRLAGGMVEISSNENIETIKARLLSTEGMSRRVVLLDNLKSMRFSWQELESLITAPTVSGKRLYHGESSRPNILTWLCTLNGVNLSTDMAQRCVVIKIKKPRYAGSWEDDTANFVLANRRAIIADLIGFLRQEPYEIAREGRWGAWERAVLARLPDCQRAQYAIRQRQQGSDVEEEEIGIFEEFIRGQLRDLRYAEDARVFIPSAIMAEWYCRATNERHSVTAVSRMMRQRISEGSVLSISVCRNHDLGRGFIFSDHENTISNRENGIQNDKSGVLESPEKDLRERIQERQERQARGF